jgi:hypothetical protein
VHPYDRGRRRLKLAKFIMIYKGQAQDMSEMTPEQGAEVMAKWQSWMGKVGSALVDIGTPFGPGTSVVDDGSSAVVSATTGYSIVEAANLADAVKLSDGHPYLSEGKGNFSMDIFELMPVPFEA